MYVRIASRTTTKLCRAQQLLAIAHQESLHQVHVAGGETGVTIGQIVMPHAQEACIEAQTADLGLGGVHPALPGLEGAGVMLAVEVPRHGLEPRLLYPLFPDPG